MRKRTYLLLPYNLIRKPDSKYLLHRKCDSNKPHRDEHSAYFSELMKNQIRSLGSFFSFAPKSAFSSAAIIFSLSLSATKFVLTFSESVAP